MNLSGVEAEEAKVVINNGAKVDQSASLKLSIEMNGGSLKMAGNPVIELVGIKNGTVERK